MVVIGIGVVEEGMEAKAMLVPTVLLLLLLLLLLLRAEKMEMLVMALVPIVPPERGRGVVLFREG